MHSGAKWRYLATAAFTLGLVVLGAAARGAFAAEVGEERRDPLRFGDDLVALHRDGWSLAWVEHDDGAEGQMVSVTITLVDAPHAHALRVELDFADGGERPVAYTRASVAVPEPRRVYDGQDALFEALAGGAVRRLYDECGTSYLQLVGDAEVELPEYDYYVPGRHVEGAAAGRALADELRSRLGAGAHLADVHETGSGVGFLLVDASGTPDGATLVAASLDDSGNLLAVDVRQLPSTRARGRLASEGRLARALRGRSVRRVSLSADEDLSRVKLEFTRGKSFVIDLAEMEYPEEADGCGC